MQCTVCFSPRFSIAFLLIFFCSSSQHYLPSFETYDTFLTSVAIAAMLVRFNINNFFVVVRWLALKLDCFCKQIVLSVYDTLQCNGCTMYKVHSMHRDTQTDRQADRHKHTHTHIISIWDGDEVKEDGKGDRRETGD